MTKTRMGLGVFGIALAAACIAWGIQAQEKLTGQGNFRLTVGPSGINCYQVTKGTTNFTAPCVRRDPTGTVTAFTSIAILTTTSTDGKDPCYIRHNNVTYEVPCD